MEYDSFINTKTALDFMYLIYKAKNGDYNSDSHMITLFSLALSIKAKNILELGVYKGNTTLPLLMAAQINGGFLNSVDLHPTGYEPPAHLKQFWKFHAMDSIYYLNQLPELNKKIDLVFIDDWHDGEHVYNELMLIEPFVDKSSLILLHDAMYGSHPEYNLSEGKGSAWFSNYGPYGALRKLDRSVWEYTTIPVDHGLTILRKY